MTTEVTQGISVDYHLTRVFNETLDAWNEGYRRCLHQGGTSSSKTFSILQFLIELAKKSESPLTISIVSESLPHLKRGAMADFFKILGEQRSTSNPNWRSTDFIYRRPEWHEGVFIEFYGADDADLAHGPRRDILFINEGNNIPWTTVDQMDTRTDKFVIVDWNPTSEFWVHEYLSGGTLIKGWIHDLKNNKFVKSTYLDARYVLSADIVKKIESHQNDENWWRVYGLGETGNVEELVYPKWNNEKQIIDKLPDGDYFYGLDWGYSDPTALVKNCIIGSNLYSQEFLWGVNWQNDYLAIEMERVKVRKHIDKITVDNAHPQLIKFLVEKGYYAIPCEKASNSERAGHLKVNEYLQYWTRDSVNCIKEQRNFRYIRKKYPGGQEYISQDTTHFFSHGMSARRYGVETYEPPWSGPDSPAVYY